MQLNYLKKILPIIIVIFVIITLVALLVIPLLSQDSDNQNGQSNSNQETIIFPPRNEVKNLSKNVKEIRQGIIANPIADNKGDLLLHQTNSFKIEYIPSLDFFYVRISAEPVETYKRQAQEWFLNFDLEESHLCNFSIRFILDFNLKKTNPNFSSLPIGCQ